MFGFIIHLGVDICIWCEVEDCDIFSKATQWIRMFYQKYFPDPLFCNAMYVTKSSFHIYVSLFLDSTIS